ncbi:aldolase/citrate lyase family protein [Methylocystis sp. SB2]|uniref:aldolase/citrate lyase family protein n=1 Tax=Methylocystis sp. (strain SB2) TaxID=743836 RepID=UPI0003F7D6C9|nr:aldolase/citrate lyase family protein [Methylocystis sp. SB2]ULO23593.1 aldolase/citrate lyase family protein [Methylocystis sp. SB2]
MILESDASDEDVAAALFCGADAILFRLGPCAEDEARRSARARACTLISEARCKSAAPKLFVEVAPLENELIEADLDALFGPGPEGVFLPSCDGAASLQRMSVKLAVREAQAGLADGATRIGAFAGGDPGAALALRSLAGASPRLGALAFDEAGLRAALGLAEGDGAAVQMARGAVVLASASAGVPALAAPIPAGENEAYAAARRDGFRGAMALFPGEIAAIHEVFPTGENRQRPQSSA